MTMDRGMMDGRLSPLCATLIHKPHRWMSEAGQRRTDEGRWTTEDGRKRMEEGGWVSEVG